MPDSASEPPHCSARVSAEAGHGVRRAAFASTSISATIARPRRTVSRCPPTDWMFIVLSSVPVSRPSLATVSPSWLISQPSPTSSTAATFGWRA